METKSQKKEARPIRQQPTEQEILEREMFKMLAEFRNVLSPYWSMRVEHSSLR